MRNLMTKMTNKGYSEALRTEFKVCFINRITFIDQPYHSAAVIALDALQHANLNCLREACGLAASSTNHTSYKDVLALQKTVSRLEDRSDADMDELTSLAESLRTVAADTMYQHIIDHEPGLFKAISHYVMVTGGQLDDLKVDYYTAASKFDSHMIGFDSKHIHRKVSRRTDGSGLVTGYKADFAFILHKFETQTDDSDVKWLATRSHFKADGSFVRSEIAHAPSSIPTHKRRDIQTALHSALHILDTTPLPATTLENTTSAHGEAKASDSTTTPAASNPIRQAIEAACANYKRERESMFLPGLFRQHGLQRANALQAAFSADDNPDALSALYKHLSVTDIGAVSSVGLSDDSFETHLIHQLLQIMEVTPAVAVKHDFKRFTQNATKDHRQQYRKQLLEAITKLRPHTQSSSSSTTPG